MTRPLNVISRTRGFDGRFMGSGATGSSAVSLANHKRRQKEYLFRKTQTMKRLIMSFVRAFVVKEPGSKHWIPGAEKDSLLLDCMESLLVDSSLESRRSSMSNIKHVYFKGNAVKKVLPTITFRERRTTKEKPRRIPAFVGWRFPFPEDVSEMLSVNKWLKENAVLLKVDIKEAKNICFKMFSRYEKRSDKYIYLNFPTDDQAAEPSASDAGIVFETRTPGLCDHSTNANSSVCSKCNQSINDEALPPNAGRQESVSEAQNSTGDEEKLQGYVKEMMTVATQTSTFYKSLRLALAPPCFCKFNVLWSVWMSRFSDGRPPEEWCGLERDIFEFCRLTSRGMTNTEEYKRLRQSLTDQLEVFKLVRQSANLPLFEEDL